MTHRNSDGMAPNQEESLSAQSEGDAQPLAPLPVDPDLDSKPGAQGTANLAPSQVQPTEEFGSRPTQQIVRPNSRRRPRFVEPPKPEGDKVINRASLLSSPKKTTDKQQLTRNRQIAGNLPEWSPLPPGETRLVR